MSVPRPPFFLVLQERGRRIWPTRVGQELISTIVGEAQVTPSFRHCGLDAHAQSSHAWGVFFFLYLGWTQKVSSFFKFFVCQALSNLATLFQVGQPLNFVRFHKSQKSGQLVVYDISTAAGEPAPATDRTKVSNGIQLAIMYECLYAFHGFGKEVIPVEPNDQN